MGSTICKIVYFDEASVTDYVQIVAGGELQKTTELLKESSAEADTNVEATAGVKMLGIFKAILGLEASGSVSANASASINTDRIAKNIVKNTILTDFLESVDGNVKTNGKAAKGAIKKFENYKISVEKESLSYMVMVSPYLSMMKNGTNIPAGDFSIAVEKLENALKSAKGYYEFVGTKGNSKVILRFNISSLRNNYKINDLLKMNLSIYAIKVGTSSLDQLNINNELDIDASSILPSNPEYKPEEDSEELEDDKTKKIDVYDVLLAGVEVND
ncbi:DUF6414 family protein [Streptococcus equinus]|uniref:DUF6414 family protein n=1 Tax=Streptococcus equinus TaxID=1335 RepID=UPI0012F791E8|nr:DUF6414 family protein [Streptococcus equinus]QGX45252.1 hypothetical protein GO596_08055 [Streptococcus equinus]